MFITFSSYIHSKGDNMDFQNTFRSILLFGMLFGLGFAGGTDASASIEAGLCELYCLINSVLVIVVFLLIVAAAVVYAGGQLLGAETRARASVWATSMFIGALIGVLIYIIVPMVLSAMDPAFGTSTCTCGGGSGRGIATL
jgi:hypothetical protein